VWAQLNEVQYANPNLAIRSTTVVSREPGPDRYPASAAVHIREAPATCGVATTAGVDATQQCWSVREREVVLPHPNFGSGDPVLAGLFGSRFGPDDDPSPFRLSLAAQRSGPGGV
jgi:hypothetical protein